MRELFVVSIQRSGSNWLQRCLKNYPGLLINGELNPSANLAKLDKIKTGDHVSNALINDMGALQKAGQGLIRYLMRCNVGMTDLDKQDPTYLCDKTAFPAAASLRKYPEQYQYISLLQKYFPDSKKIMLIRDVRDVIVSYSEWRNEHHKDLLKYSPRSAFYFLRVLRNWCELHEVWFKSIKGDNNFLVIQYSDMKNNFELVMKRVFQFLELDIDDEFIKNIHDKNYDINSKDYKEENEKRGYVFFRKGIEGEWQEKFGFFHKLVFLIFFKKRTKRILEYSLIHHH